MESLKTRIQRLNGHIKEREGRGQPLSAEDLKKINDQKEADTKAHAESHKFVQNVRAQLDRAASANRNAQGQPNAQHGRSQSGSMPGQNAAVSAPNNPMHAMAASVNAAMDAAKNQQMGGANNRAQGHPGQPQMTATPVTPSTTTAAAPQQPQQAKPAQQSHAAPTPQQPQVKIEPGTQQQPPQAPQQPPPVNTALAAASASHMPSAGTPTQNSARVQTPKSGTQPQAQAQAQLQPQPQPQQQQPR